MLAMRRTQLTFFLLTILLLVACSSPEATPTPTIPSPPPLATVEATQTATPSPTEPATQPAASPTPIPPTPTPAFPAYTGPPIARADYGIQIHLHQEDQRELLRHLQALGVGWVKVQVSWKLYESQPGQYDDFRFDELDRLVEAANNNGMDVMLSVAKAPEWSRPTTELDGPPSDFALYTQFMQQLASRYTGQVAAYELWNEPNLKREWNGMDLNAAEVTRLITAGAAGVRSADPEALIISAAPATTGINNGIDAIDDRVFLRQMMEAGVGDVVDGIGVHPYGWANPPDSSVFDTDSAVPSHNNHPSFFWRDTLDDYSDILAEYDSAELPLWVTEFGWGTFERLDNLPPIGAEFMNNVTEWQQAEYILRAYELASERDNMGPMILWNLNFAPTLGNEFSESGYSVLRHDGSRRPSYLALEAMAKQ